ncbi:phosphoribosylamine--glycine ligase [Corynebacterium falsenii]|uniref:Phosphoribosylamine--glycine ligase n=2 Tax=Corynebacterium falsenii TaxID=108486 RepID=A0A418Q6I9_9CORY|nr:MULTISPECIES: phosphoribosylamine--glycine ligase [unclassified Brevibacterium]MCQ9367633.1 phosphoribosylamine--glycine ligase [Brevibacterium sp. 91QC2O2]MCQ9389007.1 phosphoribosylamine--glycine ligase [Brevibacterium sp. 50QC2O2]RIX34597.1 phosphoribosylamine--glycine ligase [Corynebacterium falsenii]
MDSDFIALVIASISLLVAGLSLGWQIAQWLLSAGRPKAKLLHGVQGRGGLATGPVEKSGEPRNFESLREQGFNGPEIIGVQVTNHGRAPVTVDRIALCTRGGNMSVVPQNELLGPALPHRLEAGTNESWYMEADFGYRLVAASRAALHEQIRGVYMSAALGSGKSISTPTTLRM